MSLYEKGSELVRKAKETMLKSKEFALRRSEKVLRIERTKMDIKDLKDQKEEKLKELARKVYELYCQNNLTNPELLGICQDIKTIQWQIDEMWTTINNMKAQKE